MHRFPGNITTTTATTNKQQNQKQNIEPIENADQLKIICIYREQTQKVKRQQGKEMKLMYEQREHQSENIKLTISRRSAHHTRSRQLLTIWWQCHFVRNFINNFCCLYVCTKPHSIHVDLKITIEFLVVVFSFLLNLFTQFGFQSVENRTTLVFFYSHTNKSVLFHLFVNECLAENHLNWKS